MDFLIEIILELIFEGTIEISSNQKVSKWIRYPLIYILILLVSLIIIGILILGMYLSKENIIISLILIISSIYLTIKVINKKQYLEKKENKNDNHN